MTKRAVLIGIFLAGVIGFVGFFNDMVMKGTFMFSNYMPIFIYGALALFVVSLNPLLARISKKLPLTGKELALIVAVLLPCCFVAGRTLIHHFTTVLMSPRAFVKTRPGWQKRDLIRRLPPEMLAFSLPEYVPGDITDTEGLVAFLQSKPDATKEPGLAKLSAQVTVAPGNSPEQLAGALNAVLDNKELFTPEELGRLNLPPEAKRIVKTGPFRDEEVRRLNRFAIDAMVHKYVRTLMDREEHAINGFLSGLAKGTNRIGLKDVPWYAWNRTLWKFWIPLILSLSFAYIGLALVVKRQWVSHEHIPFPIVTFAQSLLPDEGATSNSVIRSKPFWIAAGIVTFLHLNNYAVQWWPDYLVAFPLRLDFSGFSSLFPVIGEGGGRSLFSPSVFFVVIGFAYFVATDVSLSIGLAPWVYAIVAGILLSYGISMNSGGDYNSLRLSNFLKSGSYFGMFLIILYTGRNHYSAVLKRAVGLQSCEDVRKHEVWGLRVFAACGLVFAFQLYMVGVSFPLALFHTLVVAMTFVVVTRMVGETGMFLFHPMIIPVAVLWGFLGPRAIGTNQMLMLMFLSAVLDFGCHAAVMPMMTHGLKLAPEKPGKTAGLACAALVVTLIIAVLTSLYFQYNLGSSAAGDGWGTRLAQVGFRPIEQVETRMEAQGILEQGGKMQSEVGFFASISPNRECLIVFFIAMALVLGTELIRLRVPKWPIHPVLFLISGFWHAQVLAFSFMLGWAIKVVVHKYGGASNYRKLKPMMIGLIAGDMLAGIIILIIGFIYYWITGDQPKSYKVIPG